MRSNKKGFTIVELVIVIAVIAILAAVLIPTIAGLVKKANVSADQQAVVQMNKLLAMNEKAPANTDEVVDVLIKNGYSSDLSTYYAGHTLAWLKADNSIVLVENGKVVYPKNHEGETAGYEVINPIADKITDGSALAGALTDGEVVYVNSDITTDELSTSAAGEYKVNLGGNVLACSYIGSWLQDASGKLVVSNGTITLEEYLCTYPNNTVELNNVQVYGNSGTNPIRCIGGTLVLNNVTTSQSGNATDYWFNSAIQVVNNIVQDKDTGVWKVTAQADTTIEGGMYSGSTVIMIDAPGGNVTITGGTFNATKDAEGNDGYAIRADFAPTRYIDGSKYESVITIEGGNFNGNIQISAATELVINGGNFTCDDATAEIIKANVAVGKTVTINDKTFTKTADAE